MLVGDSTLREWLVAAAREEASDLHIVHDAAPVVRVHGKLKMLLDEPLNAEQVHAVLMKHCPEEYCTRFHAERNLDFAIEVQDESGGCHRFRANYFYAGDQIGACFRHIQSNIPDFFWANFPDELAAHITGLHDGLVLFSGVAGSGKTTSLAMIIDHYLKQGDYRIVTIEEPVEYLFRSDSKSSSVITQREVGKDVATFADGLKYGLRQDPDIILVGEIRDRETAQIALSAAETGHLVFATLHTRDAKGAISRFADLFESNMQNEIRAQLALSLRSVISQRLLPSSIPDEKRELAVEVLHNNDAIASSIRAGKVEMIENNIQTGLRQGMISMDESIKRLVQAGRITRQTAEKNMKEVSHLNR